MGGYGNAEALMGHRLHGRGVTPKPSITWGAAGAERDKQQSQVGSQGLTPSPSGPPPPQEVPLGQYLVLWGS